KEVNSVVWSPDGTRLASANTYGAPVQISVSDATNGHLISTYTGYPENSFEEVVNIAWSPDGKYLAASVSVEDGPPDYNKTYMVQVWDAGNNHHVCSINMEPDGASTLTWSPDSKRLAIGESSGAVSMWHLPL
ncbi:MAG: PD40 domain-containing protein, partial [Ktedonobacteraceae bacterium]|nr:PD40 domain-containing protein [Ktedonobacteraceae bacterium]